MRMSAGAEVARARESRSKEGRFRSDLRVRDSLVEIIDVKLPHKARVV